MQQFRALGFRHQFAAFIDQAQKLGLSVEGARVPKIADQCVSKPWQLRDQHSKASRDFQSHRLGSNRRHIEHGNQLASLCFALAPKALPLLPAINVRHRKENNSFIRQIHIEQRRSKNE